MPLTGQAKTDYQREYMQRRRSNVSVDSVRPARVKAVRPIRPVRPYTGELTKTKQVSGKGFND